MDKKRGLMLVFFTAAISGFSIFINKFGVSGINPYVFTFGKNVLACVFLFSTIMLLGNLEKLKCLKPKGWTKLAVIGLVGGSIPFLLFFKGLSMTAGATASFIHKTMFVYVLVLAGLFLKERLSWKIVIGALFLLAGNFLLLKINSFPFSVGSLLVLVATLFWAVENTFSKYVLRTMDPKVVAFGRMFFGSGFILLFLAVSGNAKHLLALTFPQVSWVFVTSLFLFFYLLTWYSGLKHTDVSVATCVLLLGSPITTILSFAFLGADLTLAQSIGILSLLAGLYFAVTSSYRMTLPWRHVHGEGSY